ncbi:MAG: Ig-like domain-containing protein [Acidimicrobiales bacterium]
MQYLALPQRLAERERLAVLVEQREVGRLVPWCEHARHDIERSQEDPTGVLRARASGLSAGSHSATVTAVDGAGNQTSLRFSFVVDLSPPALADPSPTGQIATSTPLLEVTATDADTGIDPASISMTVASPYYSPCRVPATFDATSGRISYQIPATPPSPCPGLFPLLPGSYDVAVGVADRADNPNGLTWSFTVSTWSLFPTTTLPLPLPGAATLRVP